MSDAHDKRFWPVNTELDGWEDVTQLFNLAYKIEIKRLQSSKDPIREVSRLYRSMVLFLERYDDYITDQSKARRAIASKMRNSLLEMRMTCTIDNDGLVTIKR